MGAMYGLAAVLLIVLATFAQQPADGSQSVPSRYRVGVGPAEPKCDYTPDPQYTVEAKRANAKGTVVVSTTVGVDGCLRDVSILRSLGYGLDEAAVEALRRWHCKPNTRNGKPTPTRLQIEVHFDPKFSQAIAEVTPCTERTSLPSSGSSH
jgi:TonB family protein